MRLELGDCLEKLKDLPDNSVDSIVTDPPYGLSFMNKTWDYDVPSTEIWVECLRVLKPGGHLLAFSGSRTYHRMAVRIEDAGFEVRDQIMWLYGSGFPKSHNIGKAIDKLQGNDREVVGSRSHRNSEGSDEGYKRPCDEDRIKNGVPITKGQSEWEGWGTALKPAHEPICMARKPFKGTVADNVLEWGVGGINIDASRIGSDGGTKKTNTEECIDSNGIYGDGLNGGVVTFVDGLGRWPANIILDDEAGQVLDEQSGNIKSTKFIEKDIEDNTFHKNKTYSKPRGYSDKGGASRFFYCAKASKKDRDEGLDGFEDKESSVMIGQEGGTLYRDNGTPILPAIRKNNHATVKPTALMEYLIKLVTPVGGTVLDPFMGSGSTGKAAVRNGYDFIGIEREEDYIKIAEARIKNEL